MSKKEDFEYFESQLSSLLSEHRGQFALVKDKAIHGYFNSIEDALKKAYEIFSTDDFLIQAVTDEAPTNYINTAFLS